jgi:hypothetical protein
MNGGPELSSKGKVDRFPRVSCNYCAAYDDSYILDGSINSLTAVSLATTANIY